MPNILVFDDVIDIDYQNTIKESFNEITLEDALSNIYNTYFIETNFVNGATNNMKNDPLFLILRLHYGNMNTINDKNEKMTIADFKNIVQTTRKYAMPILEYLDKLKITVRKDNYRKLL